MRGTVGRGSGATRGPPREAGHGAGPEPAHGQAVPVTVGQEFRNFPQDEFHTHRCELMPLFTPAPLVNVCPARLDM